jgi:NAD(P)H-dependent FMN reductase
MTIAIVSGSMRANSQSLKVSQWLKDHAEKEIDSSVELLDLHELALPMFTTDQDNGESVATVLKALDKADGIVFVSPEWNGMMSHGLVNMQHYIGQELANKPVMTVGVSAGRGGHYPLAQMRDMGYKNNHYVVTPESLLVQGVNDVFNDHDTGDDDVDVYLKKRADYGLRILVEYAKALSLVRQSGVVDLENFANGM